MISISEFQTIKNYDEYNQKVTAQNIKEISDFALNSEERANDIFEEVILDINNFFKLHTLVEFRNISDKFWKKLVRIVNTYIHNLKIRKIRRIDLEFLYREYIFILLSKRKIIFNDVLLNYLYKGDLQDGENSNKSKDEIMKELAEIMSTEKNKKEENKNVI